jgi:hypothetical protein
MVDKVPLLLAQSARGRTQLGEEAEQGDGPGVVPHGPEGTGHVGERNSFALVRELGHSHVPLGDVREGAHHEAQVLGHTDDPEAMPFGDAAPELVAELDAKLLVEDRTCRDDVALRELEAETRELLGHLEGLEEHSEIAHIRDRSPYIISTRPNNASRLNVGIVIALYVELKGTQKTVNNNSK